MATSQEWQTRISAIGDMRSVLFHLSLDQPNIEFYLQELEISDNVSQLIVLENAWLVVEPKLQSEIDKKLRSDTGKFIRNLCEGTLDIIAGWNISRGLSGTQIDTMIIDYADVLLALKNNRPAAALILVQNKSADGILVTQEMLDEIEQELTV